MKETSNGYRADDDSVVVYDKSWDRRRVQRLWAFCGWCRKVSSGSFNNALLLCSLQWLCRYSLHKPCSSLSALKKCTRRHNLGQSFLLIFICKIARAKKKNGFYVFTRPYIGTSLSHWLHCAWRFNAICHGNVRETRKPLFAANSHFSSSGCDDKMT